MFYPRKDVLVTMKHSKVMSCCPKKDKIYESELFKQHEPSFEIPIQTWKIWKGWKQIINDWSRAFQIFVPTAMISLLFMKKVDIVLALSPILIVSVFAIISKVWAEISKCRDCE